MYAHGLVGWRSLAALNVRDVIAAARAAAQACGACYTLTIAKIFTFRAGKTYCSSLDQLPYQSPRLMAITLSDVRFRGNSGHCSTPRYPMALSHQNRLERGKAYSGDSDTLLAMALIESFPCLPILALFLLLSLPRAVVSVELLLHPMLKRSNFGDHIGWICRDPAPSAITLQS